MQEARNITMMGGKKKPRYGGLTFTAVEPTTIALVANGAAPSVTLEQSFDGKTWTLFSGSVTLAAKESVFLRAGAAGNTQFATSNTIYNHFTSTGKVAASGSIMSLLSQDYESAEMTATYTFSSLFDSCTNLTTAPELTATALTSYCYSYMFNGCTSLATVPDMPSMTSGRGCCQSMFRGCSSLTAAPGMNITVTEIPGQTFSYMFYGCESLASAGKMYISGVATGVCSSMFSYMFYGCSSLRYAPHINFDASTYSGLAALTYMFQGCSSLESAASISISATATSFAASYMFDGCTSLVYGPNLTGSFTMPYAFLNCSALVSAAGINITRSTHASYAYMFQGCSHLVTGPTMTLGSSTSSISKGYYEFMFDGCSSLVSAAGVSITGSSAGDEAFRYMFNNCTSLTVGASITCGTLGVSSFERAYSRCTSLATPPALPATTLGANCYQYMFFNCTSLTTAPDLPATTLAADCYRYMFQACTSLTTAPNLPATTLADRCYFMMFYNCTSLTTAPDLPATTLADDCYSQMFQACTSLTTAPDLPATTLAYGCYSQMFFGCTSLTTAPDLPATTLVYYCYYSMFRNCTSLVRSGRIAAATSSAPNPMAYMFQGCTALRYIELSGMTTWTSGMTDWVKEVPANGLFVCPTALGTESTITRGTSNCPTGWRVNNYFGLTFAAEEAGTSVGMAKTGAPPSVTLEYSTDGATWNAYDTDVGTAISLPNIGDFVCFRAGSSGNTAFASSSTEYRNFVIQGGRVAGSGNIISLLSQNYESAGMTASWTFASLFDSCTNLTAAPELPAMTLYNACYRYMFQGCTSLTSAPELPATTLTRSCYTAMFADCTSLAKVKVGFTSWAGNSTSNWLSGVASTGKFICPAALGTDSTITRGVSNCPTGWTVVNV